MPNSRQRGYHNAVMPALAKSHVPLGVIFVTFRALREAVWSHGIYEYDRPLRLSKQARARFDIEFRPKFWKVEFREDMGL